METKLAMTLDEIPAIAGGRPGYGRAMQYKIVDGMRLVPTDFIFAVVNVFSTSIPAERFIMTDVVDGMNIISHAAE